MDEELAYLAGFFDGEGSIAITRSNNRYTMKVEVTQLDPAPLIRFQSRFGGSLFRKPDRRGYRSMISWVVVAGGAEHMLNALRPYMSVKREQADVALEFRARILNPNPDRTIELAERERLYQLCRDLKQANYDEIELPPPAPKEQNHKGKRLGWAKPKPPKKTRVKVAVPVKSTGYDRRKRPSKEMLAEVYRDIGMTLTAQNYGVSRQTIYNWLDDYGIPRNGRTKASEQRRLDAVRQTWQ